MKVSSRPKTFLNTHNPETSGDCLARGGASTGANPVRCLVRDVLAKSVLSKSAILGVDYSVNPYIGCSHGCVYCYARHYAGRLTKGSTEGHSWGGFVFPKVNAPQVIREELNKARRGLVLLSSMTDPYLPLEAKYRLTRRVLKAISDYGFPISVLTKSPLVLQDAELLSSLDEVEVGFSMSGLDGRWVKLFEPGAPTIKSRIEALKRLSRAGVRTYAFISPILPVKTQARLDELISSIREAGADRLLADLLRIRPQAWRSTREAILGYDPSLLPLYQETRRDDSYFVDFKVELDAIAAKYGYEVEYMY